jgi:hypothetical protein
MSLFRKKRAVMDPEIRDAIDSFHAGLDELRVVTGDLRQTARDLRVQQGRHQKEEREGTQNGGN